VETAQHDHNPQPPTSTSLDRQRRSRQPHQSGLTFNCVLEGRDDGEDAVLDAKCFRLTEKGTVLITKEMIDRLKNSHLDAERGVFAVFLEMVQLRSNPLTGQGQFGFHRGYKSNCP